MTRKLTKEPVANSNKCELHDRTNDWWHTELQQWLQERYAAGTTADLVLCHDCTLTARRLVERQRDKRVKAEGPQLVLHKGGKA